MIELGDQLPGLTLNLADNAGNPVDGGAVTLAVTPPSQNAVSVPVDHPAVGQYSASYVAIEPGIHVIEWAVVGAYAGTYRDTVYVEQQVSIVSLQEIKDHLGIRRSAHDEILRLIGLMASDACESMEGTNRRWRRRIITGERHSACTAGTIQLRERPVSMITSFTNNGTALDTEDYDLDPVTGLIYDVSGALGHGTRRFGLSVDYVAGTNIVPAIVRNGVLEMCRHLYGMHRGGTSLPSQEEPDYTTSLAYLIPNRVAWAWQTQRMP